MEATVPDTLVLKIVEYTEMGEKDTTMYILYDTSTCKYVIRGKRNDDICDSLPYSYECRNVHSLLDFLEFVFDIQNEYSFILYNYNELPLSSNDITFDLLKLYDIPSLNEISGYEEKMFIRKELANLLNILKNVNNEF